MIRKNLLIWTTVITSIIFIFRLGYLQLSNDFYKSASNNNAIQELAIYPERGLIFDRNGKNADVLEWRVTLCKQCRAPRTM